MKKNRKQKPICHIGYKVVIVKGGRNYSCARNVFSPDIRYNVRYLLNKWVFPFEKCGPLAVFNNLLGAKKFLKIYLSCWKQHGDIYKIYRCEYDPSKGDYLFVGRRDIGNRRHLVSLPNGTILARSVKLKEKCFEKRVK